MKRKRQKILGMFLAALVAISQVVPAYAALISVENKVSQGVNSYMVQTTVKATSQSDLEDGNLKLNNSVYLNGNEVTSSSANSSTNITVENEVYQRNYYSYFYASDYKMAGTYKDVTTVTYSSQGTTKTLVSDGVDLFDLATVSGSVYLPDGIVATNNIHMTAFLYRNVVQNDYSDWTMTGYYNIVIPQGQNYTDFVFSTDEKSGYLYKLYFGSTEVMDLNCFGDMFYSSTETNNAVLTIDKATKIDPSQKNSGLKMTFIKADRKVSGKISLPGNEVALSSGIEVGICIQKNAAKDDYSSWSVLSNGVTFIKSGENSANYSVPVDKPEDGYKYRVYYAIHSSTSIDSKICYIYRGYYSDKADKNVTINSNDATLLDLTDGNKSGIDMSIKKGIRIDSIVSFQSSGIPDGTRVTINALYRNHGESDWSKYPYSTSTRYNGNNEYNQLNYYIPVEDADREFIFYYSLDALQSIPLIGKGYYSSQGTTMQQSKAKILSPLEIDYLQFNVLPTDRTIKGTFSLPEGFVIPDEGLNIYVNAIMTDTTTDSNGRTTNNSYDIATQKISLTKDKPQSEYVLNVPSSVPNGKVKVGYYFSSNTPSSVIEKYSDNGYSASDGAVTASFNKAVYKDISKNSMTNVNLTLIPAKLLSGTISLPDGILAPAGGLKTYIHAVNGDGADVNKLVTIPEGKAAADYILKIPEDYTACKVYVYVLNSQGLVNPYIYYAGSTMSPFQKDCVDLDMSKGTVTGLNLTLAKYASTPISAKFTVDGTEIATLSGNEGKSLDVAVDVKNNNSISKNALLIVALYDANGAMVNVSYVSQTINSNQIAAMHGGFKLPDTLTGYTVKAFVWEGTSLSDTTQEPVSGVVELK